MTECNLCGNYINEDKIRECPECLKEMCEYCYEIHVPICYYVSENDYIDNYDE